MNILAKQGLRGSLTGSSSLTGDINADLIQLTGEVNVNAVAKQDPIYYEGDYTVKPTVESQTIHTKEKTMKNDFHILAIPYAEVTNSANGITITIGN